ncbi:MAG: aldehyde ferredoxin oxidoreductase, partial [Deltaproteobacteria bacterium]|nr:aldehyde ferredoxin oxidoreductase [Deltaproteobacteria bacterium]
MDKGCNGQILRVDLSNGSLNEEFPDEYIYRKYMGGSALALYYLLKELKPRVDPLGPENKLVIMSSVIQGVATPGVVRFTV